MTQQPADGERPTTTEVGYRWPDGREEVRYRRPFGSIEAELFVLQIKRLNERHGEESPYFVRHV